MFDVIPLLNNGLTLEIFNSLGNIPVDSGWLINKVNGLISKSVAYLSNLFYILSQP